ncbi:MAG: hypothetical protein JO112_02460 [Planctomycetes bacterium]|nr:hypothetical protein [Planctomycetota bacterium]
MRMAMVLFVGVVCVAGVRAQVPKETSPDRRYGFEVDLENYPQATPQDTVKSVLTALNRNQVAYLLAQLTDPAWVDQRVKGLGGNFEDLVKEVSSKLSANPGAIRDLQRFANDGKWDVKGDTATGSLEDIKDRQVFLRKVGNRWFLENRNK